MGGRYRPGDEVVPGYRVQKFFGEGGFGEVWQATAPGGARVALKIIPLVQKGSFREYRAIRQMKDIHQPNLVEIFGIWLKDQRGQMIDTTEQGDLRVSMMVSPTPGNPSELVIAMGLGDRSLYDLLEMYRKEGKEGIPAPELIEYMEDAAAGIDFLNRPIHSIGENGELVAIEHCDIKPQNLLQVGTSVQVCDFGLARPLSGGSTTVTAAQNITPFYAAPELLIEGRPSDRTDQYMLAVSYVELRTGKLPFPSTLSRFEVMERHYEGKLDLSLLSPAEQRVIRRAVSLRPEERWETTREMVDHLRDAIEHEGDAPPPGPPAAGAGLAKDEKIGSGYTLVAELEKRPGFSIWRAQASGGREVAVVARNLRESPLSIELRALSLIASVEGVHENLSEMHAVWMRSYKGQTIHEDMEGALQRGEAEWLFIAGRLVGQTMDDLLRTRRRGGFSWEELREPLRGVADAIDYLNHPHHQSQGKNVSIVHNNVRPASLLPDAKQSLRLGNHSLARVVEGDERSIPANSLPDHPYLAPEVREGLLTRWSDQYSFALTFLVLRMGWDPPQSVEELETKIVELFRQEARRPTLPPEVCDVLRRALDTPRKRFPNCMALWQALDEAHEAEGGAFDWQWLLPWIGLGVMLAGSIVYLRHHPEYLEYLRKLVGM